MTSKTNLLKEIGWDDALVRHFLIEDNDYSEKKEPELQTEIYESNSLTFTYDAQVSGQYIIRQAK